MTWRTARARISNVSSPMLTLISGPLNAFLWNLINRVMITFRDIFSSTHLYHSCFTRLILHAVNNTGLTPVTACWLQLTTRGIEISRGSLGLVPTVHIQEMFVLSIDKRFLFNKTKYLFQMKLNKMISNTKPYTFYWLMCIWIVGVKGFPVTGVLSGMNLSKPGKTTTTML